MASGWGPRAAVSWRVQARQVSSLRTTRAPAAWRAGGRPGVGASAGAGVGTGAGASAGASARAGSGSDCRCRWRRRLGLLVLVADQNGFERHGGSVRCRHRVSPVEHQRHRSLLRGLGEEAKRRRVLGLERRSEAGRSAEGAEHDRQARGTGASCAEELIAQRRVAIAAGGESGARGAASCEGLLDRLVYDLGEPPTCRGTDALELHHDDPGAREALARLVTLVHRREGRGAGGARRTLRLVGALPGTRRLEYAERLLHRAVDVGTRGRHWPSFRRASLVDRGDRGVIFEVVPSAGFVIVGITWIPAITNQGGHDRSVSKPGRLARDGNLGSLKRGQRSPPSRWLGVHVVRHTATGGKEVSRVDVGRDVEPET